MASPVDLSAPAGRPIDGIAGAHALFEALSQAREEHVAFVYLDPEWSVLGMRFAAGSADAIDLPVRAVVADALAFDAAAVVMAHNHPSGIAAPSEADIVATRTLFRALAALDVRLADHLILTVSACVSFRQLGLM